MSIEILEEYCHFFLSDQELEEHRRIRSAVAEILPADWADRRRRYWISELSKHDHSMINAVGLTVEDLVDLRDARLRQRQGGRALPRQQDRVLQRQRAYQAIFDAGMAGLSWGQAIDSAQVASRMIIGRREAEIDRKTLDAWLRVLHEWGAILIEPPPARTRGRPRKKE